MEDDTENCELISFLLEYIQFLSVFATINKKHSFKNSWTVFFFPKMPCLTLHGTELLAVNFADEEEINIGGLSSRSALPKWEPLILYGHLNLDLI